MVSQNLTAAQDCRCHVCCSLFESSGIKLIPAMAMRVILQFLCCDGVIFMDRLGLTLPPKSCGTPVAINGHKRSLKDLRTIAGIKCAEWSPRMMPKGLANDLRPSATAPRAFSLTHSDCLNGVTLSGHPMQTAQ